MRASQRGSLERAGPLRAIQGQAGPYRDAPSIPAASTFNNNFNSLLHDRPPKSRKRPNGSTGNGTPVAVRDVNHDANVIAELADGQRSLLQAGYVDRAAGLRLPACAARMAVFCCAACAARMAGSSPGKRRSISVQRDEFCISTPRRSLWIRPASRSTLKCCESVDLGTAFSLMPMRLEQLRGQAEATISA